jgi:hypothetical protein
MANILLSRHDLIKAYDTLVKGIEQNAHDDNDTGERAYGGVIRAGKGKLVESLAKNLVIIAWSELNQKLSRLDLTQREAIKIRIKNEYISKIENEKVKEFIQRNIDNYFYKFRTDVHVMIDNKFVLGIECKAYTENAMLKRIMVDFSFLHNIYPEAKCVLLQLESQLTGDYSQIYKDTIYGSYSSHSIMSYFENNLNIVTLLEGERKVNEAIHKGEFYKELKIEALDKAVEKIKSLLKDFI